MVSQTPDLDAVSTDTGAGIIHDRFASICRLVVCTYTYIVELA
jgi:hypothetical protein